MLTVIDIHQPAILSAMAALPAGSMLELANVPAGSSVSVRDDRWLEIDTGESCKITVSVGKNAIEDYKWTRGPNIEG